jgi:hypothetical protein
VRAQGFSHHRFVADVVALYRELLDEEAQPASRP